MLKHVHIHQEHIEYRSHATKELPVLATELSTDQPLASIDPPTLA